MRSPARLAHLLLLLAACLVPSLAAAGKQTVCTITINSPDEQQTFQRFLPRDKYQFVELVERNRPDWLASACEAKVACDVLVVSGHYGEGNEFFSDVMEIRESLAIAELERVSCSGACPSLFGQLKEVYLFGCDTLNPNPQRSVSEEIVRSFVREGHSQARASQLARSIGSRRGESSRDRMRLVFRDVPVIYGFSSKAPLGPSAASSLARYFQSGGTGEIGKGRASSRLLRQFSAQGMVAARGMSEGDALASVRRDVCTFADERLSPAQRLESVHALLQRPAAESRLMLDRIERFAAKLDEGKRRQPEVAQALERISRDSASRERYLAFARDADRPETRARMIHVAHTLGWLSTQQRQDEYVGLFKDMLARPTVAGTDVDLACRVNKGNDLQGAADRLALPPARAGQVGHAAVLACLGDAGAHEQALQGLISPSDADVRLAQVYLRHRPIANAGELRKLTTAIAAMTEPQAQARALDVLARHYPGDPEIVETLEQLFAQTRSPVVQNAIAGVLIRADRKAIATADLLRTLREHRLQSSGGGSMVDALIQRLQLS